MFKRRDSTESGRIGTLIGRNVHVQGDIEFSGGLHIDGHVSGNVYASSGSSAALTVSEHAAVEGSVAATSVLLNGRVEGDIFAVERLVLGPKARVRGSVHYGVIEMEVGAQINGRLVPRGVEVAGTEADANAAAELSGHDPGAPPGTAEAG